MALRAFDDVKESVRSAAAGLLRSLRGISLRLMDRQQTPAAGAGDQGNGRGLRGSNNLNNLNRSQSAWPCCGCVRVSFGAQAAKEIAGLWRFSRRPVQAANAVVTWPREYRHVLVMFHVTKGMLP